MPPNETLALVRCTQFTVSSMCVCKVQKPHDLAGTGQQHVTAAIDHSATIAGVPFCRVTSMPFGFVSRRLAGIHQSCVVAAIDTGFFGCRRLASHVCVLQSVSCKAWHASIARPVPDGLTFVASQWALFMWQVSPFW